MRNILEWTGIIAGGVGACVIFEVLEGRIWFVAVWAIAMAVAVLPGLLIYGVGPLSDTSADQQTCPPSGAAVTHDEARQAALTVPAGQTVH